MSDDKSKPGGQDRQRINVDEDYELRDWSRRLGVSPERLRAVVKAVGDRVDEVERHLRKR